MSTMSIDLSGKRARNKVWFISELFYPEETSTGYILTKLAEGLVKDYDINVLTSNRARQIVPKSEVYRSIKIYRCFSTRFNKNNIFLRLINVASFNFSILISAINLLSKNDIVLVVTNPPILPYIVLLAAKKKKAKVFILVHDVYPDLLVPVGLLSPKSLAFRFWAWLNKLLFRKANLIIAISNDMKRLISDRYKSHFLEQKIFVIPNWGEVDIIRPVEKSNCRIINNLGINDKFVVQYAGNFGRPNDLETIVEAVKILKQEENIYFLFAGNGAKRKWVEEQKQKYNFDNLTILGSFSRNEQQDILNASDVSLIALVKGMEGISVPSRFYNIMASGKPVIAIIDENTEIASIIKNEGIGWIVTPGNTNLLVNTILNALFDTSLKEKGLRSRWIVQERYNYEKILSLYREAIERLSE